MGKIKSLVLLSGGLDSILAAKILIEQGIRVVGLSFKSYFFGADFAKKAAKDLKIPLKVIDFSKEHLEIVKKPKYNYGKGMNPCIDCHILMLKKAKYILEKGKFDFAATGEVLGERPMSQNKRALKLVEKESSLKGFLLRPLSAKLLGKTIPEEKGWIDREKLFDISGRSRKRQITLAKKWKIEEYPTPAGGCLLCDLEFSKRLRELFERYPKFKGQDIELLKIGRHFWFSKSLKDKQKKKNKVKKVKIVVGRNQTENLKLNKLVKKGDVLIELKELSGPTTLVRNYGRGKISYEVLDQAKAKTKHYSTKARKKKEVKFNITLKI